MFRRALRDLPPALEPGAVLRGMTMAIASSSTS